MVIFMINKELIGNFSKVIGYIDIILNIEGFEDVKRDYENIRDVLLMWVKKYYINKNFDTISYEESFDIHEKMQEIRDKKIFDKNLGMEAMITDQILIIYEVIIKSINDGRGGLNGKR